jgi:nucleotide-binding universal stress UspA family protein
MDEIKKILIATDGSEYTKEAVKKGLSLAKMLNAEVIGLYVVDVSPIVPMSLDETAFPMVDFLRNEGDEVLEKLKKQAEDMGVKIKTIKKEGIPADEIVETAKEEDVDLIVIGTLGRSALEKLLLGSVAEKVIRHAPCPVFVVRIKNGGK